MLRFLLRLLILAFLQLVSVHVIIFLILQIFPRNPVPVLESTRPDLFHFSKSDFQPPVFGSFSLRHWREELFLHVTLNKTFNFNVDFLMYNSLGSNFVP